MSAPKIRPRIETLAVHAGERRPGPEGSLVFPIYQGTVFAVPPGTDYHDIRYIRLSSTPSQRYLHDKLAAIEGAEAALATSSGMAALTATLHTLMSHGDHLLAAECLYGGTHDFLTQDTGRLGWGVTFVDAQRPESWTAAITPRTKVFLLETIANPLMRVPRLREAVALARAHGLTTVVDNTFATPVNCRPLERGVDVVFHSATKYLNGHSDLVAGVVLGNRTIVERVRHTLNHYGGVLDPHAGFLLARGIKTLALRMAAQNANALGLAHALEEHRKARQVNYPGLHSHPDHAHAAEILDGFGGMLSLRVAGGGDAAVRFVESVTIASHAPSLGSVETLVTRPVATSHAGMKREDREKIGVTDDLVRVSVGIENVEDLIEDFRRALDGA